MSRNRIVLVVLAVALPVVAFGSLAAAAGRASDRIAPGISIHGIPVGDLSGVEAKQRLTERVRTPAQRPVTVRVGDKRVLRLSADQAGVRMDLAGAVAETQRVGEQGGLLTRGWRELTGGEINRDVALSVRYDRAAVSAFVKRIRDKVRKRPVDASLDIDVSDVRVQEGRNGRQLSGASRLEKDILATLGDPAGKREFRASTEGVRPRISGNEIYDRQPVAVTISKKERTVRVFRRGELVKTYRVAIGSKQYPTPEGLFSVQTKQVDPVWNVPNSSWAGSLAGQTIPAGDPRNPLKARWIGFNGGVGFHGSGQTSGGATSHGCIRMIPREVIDLYERVDMGTPVLVS